MENIFLQKYVFDYDAFGKRLNEQKYTGTINKNNATYSLSKKGKKMLWLFKIIKKVYNVKGNILS